MRENMKIVYSLDKNGNFLDIHECQPCPVTGGWLYPTHYTENPPPVTGEFQKAVYDYISESWEIMSCHNGQVIYHKTNRSQLKITDDRTPDDFPDYTDIPIPDLSIIQFYDYSENGGAGWVFNLQKYKDYISSYITGLCVDANYKMFPQYKRDNVYAGSPVNDKYPDYLKGDAGKTAIAKLNAVYQSISNDTKSLIADKRVQTREEIDKIVAAIVFPNESEIISMIKK
jgi:hypothetical protein